MRVHIVEKQPGPLVEHVGIDAVRPEQRDAPFPMFALRLDTPQLALEFVDLLVESLASVDAIFPRIGVDAEIANEQRRQDVKAERRQKSTNSRANNHRLFLPPTWLMHS